MQWLGQATEQPTFSNFCGLEPQHPNSSGKSKSFLPLYIFMRSIH